MINLIVCLICKAQDAIHKGANLSGDLGEPASQLGEDSLVLHRFAKGIRKRDGFEVALIGSGNSRAHGGLQGFSILLCFVKHILHFEEDSVQVGREDRIGGLDGVDCLFQLRTHLHDEFGNSLALLRLGQGGGGVEAGGNVITGNTQLFHFSLGHLDGVDAIFQGALRVGSILGSKRVDHTIELFVVNCLTDKEHGTARVLENLFLFGIVLCEGAVKAVESAAHIGGLDFHFLLECFLGGLDLFRQVLGDFRICQCFVTALDECLVIIEVVTEISHLRKGTLALDSAGRSPGLASCLNHD